MSAQTIEERLTAVETELQQLKQEREQNTGQGQDKEAEEPRGWQRIVGIFADNPLFEEAIRHGREWRESEDPADDEVTS